MGGKDLETTVSIHSICSAEQNTKITQAHGATLGEYPWLRPSGSEGETHTDPPGEGKEDLPPAHTNLARGRAQHFR